MANDYTHSARQKNIYIIESYEILVTQPTIQSHVK